MVILRIVIRPLVILNVSEESPGRQRFLSFHHSVLCLFTLHFVLIFPQPSPLSPPLETHSLFVNFLIGINKSKQPQNNS